MKYNYITFSLVCIRSLEAKLWDDSNATSNKMEMQFENIKSNLVELSKITAYPMRFDLEKLENFKPEPEFYYFSNNDLFDFINLNLTRLQQALYTDEHIAFDGAYKIVSDTRRRLDVLQNFLHNESSTRDFI